MRLVATILLLALSARPCSIARIQTIWSKTPGSPSQLFAFERDGRVGFIDAAGHIAIPPTIPGPIDDIGDFSHGLARIRHEGFVDETGQWKIKGAFWWLTDFADGLANATIEGPAHSRSTRFLDRTGQLVTQRPDDRVEPFSEGYAVYRVQGKKGLLVWKPVFISRSYPGLEGLIDRTGQPVVPATYAQVGPVSGGLARVVLDGPCHIATPEGYAQGTPTTGYPTSCGGAPDDAVSPCATGFIKPTGEIAIRPQFESARDFREGLAAVRRGGLWGFINPAGEMVIPPAFQQAQSFHEGLAAVLVKNQWGFINRAGTIVISPRFTEVEPFSDSFAVATVTKGENKQSFYVDRQGNPRFRRDYLELSPFVQGLAAVRTGPHHILYIDHSGRTVFEYDRKPWGNGTQENP